MMRRQISLCILFVLLSIFTAAEALAADPAGPEEYQLLCSSVYQSGTDVVVEGSYSVSPALVDKSSIDIVFRLGDDWSNVVFQQPVTSASATICARISLEELGLYFPPETDLACSISFSDNSHTHFSDPVYFRLPGHLLQATGPQTFQFSAAELQTCPWIRYEATEDGYHTLRLSGEPNTTMNVYYGSSFPNSFCTSFDLWLNKGESVYLTINDAPASGSLSLQVSSTLREEKTIFLNANGGSWSDIAEPSKPYVLHCQYNPSGCGGNILFFSKFYTQLRKPSSTLIGWTTAPDGTGELHAIEDWLTFDDISDGDILYAQWLDLEPGSHVIFHANHGSFAPGHSDPQVLSYPVDDRFTAPAAYREGHTLIGWHTDLSPFGASSRFYLPGEPVDEVAAAVLYAIWSDDTSPSPMIIAEANAPGVQFDGPFGVGKRMLEVDSLSNCLGIQRPGYILAGWNSEPDGTGQSFGIHEDFFNSPPFPGQLVTRLYAQWEAIDLPQRYAVFFTDETDYRRHTIIDLQSSDLTHCPSFFPQGSLENFTGWSPTTPTGDVRYSDVIYPGEACLIPENQYWYPAYDFQCLLLRTNDGFAESGNSSPVFDLPQQESDYSQMLHSDILPYAERIQRPGYTLQGWNTRPDGSGTQYDSLEDFTPVFDQANLLFAQWERNTLPADAVSVTPVSPDAFFLKISSGVTAGAAKAIAAIYDNSGQMSGCTVVSIPNLWGGFSGHLHLPCKDSTSYKVFILDAVTDAPLSPACSGKIQPLPSNTLQVATTFAGEDGNAQNYREAIKAFSDETGIQILDTSGVSDEAFKARIETDFQTGSEPDVLFYFTGTDANSFIYEDKVVSVNEIREIYPDYAANMKDDLLPTSLVDSDKYAIPVRGFWEAMFCNTAVLDASGVDLPGPDYTWDAFKADCQKIKDAGFTPIAASLGEIPHYWWEFCIFNHTNPATHTEVPGSITEGNGPGWVQGIKDIKELYELGYFPENTLSATDGETFSLFTDNKAAFLLDGSWKVDSITAACRSNANDPSTLDTDKLNHFDVTFFPSNGGERKATNLIGGLGMGYFISRKAWNDPVKRDQAVKFVEYMTSDAMVPVFAAHTLTALKHPPVVDPAQFNSLQIKAMNMVSGITSLTGAVQDVFSGECRVSTFDGMPLIVTGEVAAEDAVAEGLATYAEMVG